MSVDKARLLQSFPDELVLDLTARLVAIPTQNPPGREKPCAEFIFQTLRAWGIEAELVLEPDPERPQVVAWVRGTGSGPTLILNGHIDTVGEGDLEAWRHSPFEATREDNRLYGLGTSDMKGSLALGMVILKLLHDYGATLPGSVMLQAVMGEEMDEPGTLTLLRRGYTGDFAIVMEPTDTRIGPGTRGACWHKITLSGPSVHCGLAPSDAPDTMAFLSHFGVALADYHGRVGEKKHHLLASPACRITRVQAGRAHNSTAGDCEIIVDRRMLPHESYDQVTRELQAILDEVKCDVPGIDYSLEYLAGNEATETPLDSPLIGVLGRNFHDVLGRKPEIWGPPYGSDMRNFMVEAAIPAVNFGPGDFYVCHQPNEFVPIDDLLASGRVILGTVLDLVGGQTAGRHSSI